MKSFTKVFSIIMTCILCAFLCVTASAKTVKEATHQTTKYGGNASVFYVNAEDKGTTTLSYSCSSHPLTKQNGTANEKLNESFAGYFEVLMWGRNKTSETWKPLKTHKINIKGAQFATLKLKGYTQYKVRVYSWKTSTIGNYIGGAWGNRSYWQLGNMFAPKCKFYPKSYCNNNVVSIAQ